MFQKSYSINSGSFRAFFIIFVGAHLVAAAGARQLPNEAKAQIRQQAAFVATQPAKFSVKMPTQEIIVGTKSQVEIIVLNADNQPIAAKDDWRCEASVRFASGKSSSQTVWIKKGQTSAQFDFLAEETGLTSILVRPLLEGVRSDRVEVIVRPVPKSRKKKRMPHGTSSLSTLRDYPTVLQKGIDEVNAQFRTASFGFPLEGLSPAQAPENLGGSSNAVPVLHISLNDPNGNYKANGKDAAVISAVFESPWPDPVLCTSAYESPLVL